MPQSERLIANQSQGDAMRINRLIVMLVAGLVLLSACGADGDESSATSSDSEVSVPAEQSSDDSGDLFVTEPVPDGGSAFDPNIAERQVITTGWVEVEVDNVTTASNQAISMAEAMGGVLTGEETHLGLFSSSTITLRLPPGNLRAVLDRLSELGAVRSQSITTDDVTERVVDLASREETMATSVDRLRGFLEKAETVTDIAQLEGQLAQREADLESLRGTLRTIEGQVAMSTLTITFVAEESAPEIDEDDADSFMDVVGKSADALAATGLTIAFALGAIAVWVPMFLVLWLVYRWLGPRMARRRTNKLSPQHPVPPVPLATDTASAD